MLFSGIVFAAAPLFYGRFDSKVARPVESPWKPPRGALMGKYRYVRAVVTVGRLKPVKGKRH